jgi:hypothetical protein
LIPRRTSHESNGPGTAPSDFWRKALGDRRVVRGEEAADHVRVPAEVLRRRVEHDVGADLERVLEVRRREGVVDDDDRAGRVGRVGDRAQIEDVQHRVRRRLEPDEPRALVHVGRRVVVEVDGRHVLERVALRLVHLRGHPVDAAVDVRDEHAAVARVQ